jgi:glycerol-3-phosphate dehydrogenase
MQRDLKTLANSTFDVLIIGGGIYGAAAAHEATLRGLSVALIEKSDFGGATSSNSLKIIHGGLRYLQHADLKRMRESIRERNIVMRIAPHLVAPFPCLMPTYGHAMKGPEVMWVAMLMNDIISMDRNRGLEPSRSLLRGRIVSKAEVRRLIPGVEEKNMTAGAVWYDAQVYNSERLLLAYLHSASSRGAALANYVKAVSFLREGNQIIGVMAKDQISGTPIEIKARITINNSGGWTDEVLASINGCPAHPYVQLSTAMNLVIRRKLTDIGAGISAKFEFKDRDAVISKGSRLFFIAPWRHISMIGTLHEPYNGHPDALVPREASIEKMLNQINEAMPGAGIRRDEVTLVHRGFLPMTGVDAASEVSLQKHYRIVDHLQDAQVDGLLSVLSVKYTTARDVAVRTIDAVFRKWKKIPVPSSSHNTVLPGGEMTDVQSFAQEAQHHKPANTSAATLAHLLKNYGTQYKTVLQADADGQTPLSDRTEVIPAEIRHGIRNEMAYTLSDVVMRRTQLGTAGYPGDETLNRCADIAAQELGWSSDRKKEEIKTVKSIFG